MITPWLMLLAPLTPLIPVVADSQKLSESIPELRLIAADISSANVIIDKQSNRPVLHIVFSPSGNRRFMILQKGRLGKKIALFIGDRLVSEPILHEYIFDGRVQISGGFTFEEAQALRAELTSDAIEP
ncbi:MAG: hypothetical protein ABJO01_01385 [Parasphingorhabdus sp.]|uniref:SecDF P1 head subdomain-containing protein n=1 Tax=Parasphingorhabdus sp. TaxID=2709688 RepID=UPI00329A11B8